MKHINWLKLIIFILLCESAGVIGSVFTFSAIPYWYGGLTKPWFNPPAWVFGPAWTILYALMGISLYLILAKNLNKKNVKEAIELFVLQLILNAGWSILFFGFRNLLGAFLELIFLWLFIIETTLAFYKIDKRAAILLLPYLVWVSFAGVLNFYVWLLNK